MSKIIQIAGIEGATFFHDGEDMSVVAMLLEDDGRIILAAACDDGGIEFYRISSDYVFAWDAVNEVWREDYEDVPSSWKKSKSDKSVT